MLDMVRGLEWKSTIDVYVENPIQNGLLDARPCFALSIPTS